jgi:hypothetical protein
MTVWRLTGGVRVAAVLAAECRGEMWETWETGAGVDALQRAGRVSSSTRVGDQHRLEGAEGN